MYTFLFLMLSVDGTSAYKYCVYKMFTNNYKMFRNN